MDLYSSMTTVRAEYDVYIVCYTSMCELMYYLYGICFVVSNAIRLGGFKAGLQRNQM